MASVDDLGISTVNGMAIFVFVLTALVIYLLFRFVIPFYRKTFRNVKMEDKLVVDTIVMQIEERATNKGSRFLIQTEYMYRDSWAVSILKPGLGFRDMYVNMPIQIHCLKDNKTDILHIERSI